MRGHHRLHFVFAQPGLQANKKRVAGDAVKRGKRLIEQKQTRRGRERSSQCDALGLPSGKILRAAEGEVSCADKIQHFIYAARTDGAIGIAQAVGHVGLSVEVREERGLL